MTTRLFLRRLAALLSGIALLAALLALVLEVHAPAAQIAVKPTSVSVPTADLVYGCAAEPENTVGAVEVASATNHTWLSVLAPGSTSFNGTSLSSHTFSAASAGGLVEFTPDPSALNDAAVAVAGLTLTARASGDLRGLSGAACLPPSSVAWIVGGSAQVGNSAQLRLTNPAATTVTAHLTLYGSTGVISAPQGEDIYVPAGKSKSVLLETLANGDDQLAVSVETDSGALIVDLATQSLNGDTPAGVDVLTGGAQPATQLVIPGVFLQADADSTSAAAQSDGALLRLVNPGAKAAQVNVELVDENGVKPLAGANAVTVDPGAVFDVSLADLSGAYGIKITADHPVAAAARLVRFGGIYPEGSSTQARDLAWVQAQAANSLDASALVFAPVANESGFTSTLMLTNSQPQAASVTLTSADAQWSKTITVDKTSTVSVPIEQLGLPAGSSALQVKTDSAALYGAVIVTQSVQGAGQGTLLTVLSPVVDATAVSVKSLYLN